MLDRLSQTITDAGIPLERVEGVIGSPILVFQAVATQQQRDDAATIVANFDWSVATDTAWRLARQIIQDANTLEASVNTAVRVQRAIVAVTIDELNSLRSWITSFKAEVAASTNLANLQTRVAALPNMPQRTAAQARTAIQNKIANGDVET